MKTGKQTSDCLPLFFFLLCLVSHHFSKSWLHITSWVSSFWWCLLWFCCRLFLSSSLPFALGLLFFVYAKLWLDSSCFILSLLCRCPCHSLLNGSSFASKGNPMPAKRKRNNTDGHAAALPVPRFPEEFLCPITMEMMCDPVICADGFSYEKHAIERHFRSSDTSPMTNIPFAQKIVFPNRALKNIIETWRKENWDVILLEWIQSAGTLCDESRDVQGYKRFEPRYPKSREDFLVMTALRLDRCGLTGKQTRTLWTAIIEAYTTFIFFIWTGLIPEAVGYCIKLQRLYLDKNTLTGWCCYKTNDFFILVCWKDHKFVLFVGPIPAAISNCMELIELDLSSNQLTGKSKTDR